MSRLRDVVKWAAANTQHDRRKVYLIGGDGGTIKIGIANTPARRLRDIKTNSGRFELRVLKTWPCGAHSRYIERQAHAMLACYCTGGEWFKVDADGAIAIVEAIAAEIKATALQTVEAENVVPIQARACIEIHEQRYGKQRVASTYGQRKWKRMRRVEDSSPAA